MLDCKLSVLIPAANSGEETPETAQMSVMEMAPASWSRPHRNNTERQPASWGPCQHRPVCPTWGGRIFKHDRQGPPGLRCLGSLCPPEPPSLGASVLGEPLSLGTVLQGPWGTARQGPCSRRAWAFLSGIRTPCRGAALPGSAVLPSCRSQGLAVGGRLLCPPHARLGPRELRCRITSSEAACSERSEAVG